MTRAWLLVVLAACGDSQVIFEPVIDVPTNGTASAFPLDQLTMSIAHQGDTTDLVAATFTKGQTVSVSRVPFGDDLVVHLTGFVGTSEVAYGRSCPVSVAADSPPPEPHLYFSRLVKFGQLATDLPALRTLGVAVTYHDGSGLLLGGYDQNTGMPAGTVERFAPQTGELSVLVTDIDPDKMVPRFGAVAAPVGTGSDAQIAVIGGQDAATGGGAQVVELIEADQPQGRHVQTVPDANMSRIDLTATALTDGRVIAIGGRPPPNGTPVGDVDEVTVENGTAVVNVLRATLATPRYGHTSTRLGDDVGAAVLIAGGRDATGTAVAAAELFKPLSELFSPTFKGVMAFPRWHHQAVRMPDGSVLIIGGLDSNGPVTDLELFTQDAGFVNLMTKLPPNAGVVDFTATTLPDGRVLLTGGRQTVDGAPLDTAFIARLDPIDGSLDIVATDKLQFPRAGHQATLLCDGTVLISGGTSDQVPIERYNPPPDGRR